MDFVLCFPPLSGSEYHTGTQRSGSKQVLEVWQETQAETLSGSSCQMLSHAIPEGFSVPGLSALEKCCFCDIEEAITVLPLLRD